MLRGSADSAEEDAPHAAASAAAWETRGSSGSSGSSGASGASGASGSSWETLHKRLDLSARKGCWRVLLSDGAASDPIAKHASLQGVTAIRLESLDGYGINCRVTGLRLRALPDPIVLAPSPPPCAVAPHALALVKERLVAAAAGGAGADAALAALRSDADAMRAAFALLLECAPPMTSHDLP